MTKLNKKTVTLVMYKHISKSIYNYIDIIAQKLCKTKN